MPKLRFKESPKSPNYEETTWNSAIDEQSFREKLFDAMGMDEHQDATQAMFNEYIPPRWRDNATTATGHSGSSREGGIPQLPLDLNGPPPEDDEEYAEWVRYGMWARTHKQEHEERERRRSERKEREERERRARRETRRAEKEEADRRRKRKERSLRRAVEREWEAYEVRWKTLRDSGPDVRLEFGALPWPTCPPPKQAEDLTKDNISSFLLSTAHSADKSRRQRIREALLAYHPDRYENRWMTFVEDPEKVKNGIGKVVRALNALAEEG